MVETCILRIFGPEHYINVKIIPDSSLPGFIKNAKPADQFNFNRIWEEFKKHFAITEWGRYEIGENSLKPEDNSYKIGGDYTSIWAYSQSSQILKFLNWGVWGQPGTQDPLYQLTETVVLYQVKIYRRFNENTRKMFNGFFPADEKAAYGVGNSKGFQTLLSNPKDGNTVTWEDATAKRDRYLNRGGVDEPPPAPEPKRETAYIPESGMTPEHFAAVQAAVKEEKDLIVLFRLTNPKGIPLIKKGCPGKPKDLEIVNTSQEDGIVTVDDRAKRSEVFRRGYWVVLGDKRAWRLRTGGDVRNHDDFEQESLHGAFWRVKEGQVLDKKLKLPIVGDYDLMGVMRVSNPGQNVTLVAVDGEVLKDWTNPMVKRVAARINKKIGTAEVPERVLHGAQDNYGDFKGGAVGFFPEGTAQLFATQAEVEAFYARMRRKTRSGSYR